MLKSKKNKEILLMITFTVLLVFALINFPSILNLINYILKLFMPFIIGIIIAFVLNVLVNLIENKWFKKINKKWNKFKRPLSVITSLIIILGSITLIIVLIVHQLKSEFQLPS